MRVRRGDALGSCGWAKLESENAKLQRSKLQKIARFAQTLLAFGIWSLAFLEQLSIRLA